MRRGWLLALPFLMFTAACSGSSSPVSPSVSSGAGGATIAGSFVTAGSGGTARMGRTAAVTATSNDGMSVFVTGTGISAVVRGGQFSLQGVPAGPLALKFSGEGIDDELDLDPIESTEDIEIEVGLDGASVTLESQRRSLGREVQLEGRVESLPPTTAAASLMVAGQLVTTTLDTRFFLRGKPADFMDLAVGVRVHVKGQPGATSLEASVIDIQNTNTDLPVDDEEDNDADESASIHGELMSIGGSGDLLTLLVGSTTVTTDSNTVVQRRGDKQPLANLVAGMALHVVGTRQPDSSILARKIQIKDDAATGAFEIAGSMGGVKGTCPSLTFKVNGYSVTTDGLTTFTPDCSTFKSGTKALVTGVVQADGSVIATAVTKP